MRTKSLHLFLVFSSLFLSCGKADKNVEPMIADLSKGELERLDLIRKHGAQTSWCQFLGQSVDEFSTHYSVDFQHSLGNFRQSPVAFHCIINDIIYSNSEYIVTLSDNIGFDMCQLECRLVCDSSQIANLLARRESSELYVVAKIDTFLPMVAQRIQIDNDIENIYLDIYRLPDIELIATGHLLDFQFQE